MELEYKNYIVRIVHNPNDIILRFIEKDTQRIWEVTLTERDFVEYQVLGGLEFVLSLLKNVLQKNKDLEFKVSSKQLSFTIQYQPDDHCKKLNLDFTLPAIKKISAGVDLDDVIRRLASLEKYIRIQENTIVLLKDEVELQKDKSSGYIIIPGCKFAIPDDILELNLGLVGTVDSILNYTYGPTFSDYGSNRNTVHYIVVNSSNQVVPNHGYVCDSLKNLNNLKFFQKCHSLTLVTPGASDYSVIGKMKSLKKLYIIFQGVSSPMNINWISDLVNLESVAFVGCAGLTDISPLTKLKNLKSINIRGSSVQNTSMFGSHIQITN